MLCSHWPAALTLSSDWPESAPGDHLTISTINRLLHHSRVTRERLQSDVVMCDDCQRANRHMSGPRNYVVTVYELIIKLVKFIKFTP